LQICTHSGGQNYSAVEQGAQMHDT
jgi:hypothetical protein